MREKYGFTYVEVILVLSMIYVISQLVIFSVNAISNKAFLKSVDLLAEELRFIQRMAIVNGKDYSIVFLKGEGTNDIKEYRIYEGSVSEDNYRSIILPKGVIISVNIPHERYNTFTYNPRGTVSSGGTVNFSYNNKAKNVIVNIGAGRVRIE